MAGSASPLEGERLSTYDLLTRSASAALELQRDDGSFPPGQNGVYEESETPLRTTSYWLVALSKAFEHTDDTQFADAAEDAADYLLGDAVRPYGYTFHSRDVDGKDRCDGLIGQAAPIRALATAGETFRRPEWVEVASEVFSLHPFEERLGLWERIEIDGTPLSFDRTLNHQLVFSVAGSILGRSEPGPRGVVSRFVDALESNLELRADGLIRHYVHPPRTAVTRTVAENIRNWDLLLNALLYYPYSISSDRRRKERGYHPFCLKALGQLKRAFPDHEVWGSEALTGAVEYARLNAFDDVPDGSMLPNVDVAVGLYYLADVPSDRIAEFVRTDVEAHFDFSTGLFTKNAVDPAFQSSLVGDLAYLPNIELQVDSQ